MHNEIDILPIEGTDYVELYVSNAKQAAYFYILTMGFSPLAYGGLETGWTDKESYVISQDKVRLVLTSPLTPHHVIGDHISRHGDSVKAIALRVPDTQAAYDGTLSRGAISFSEPTRTEDKHGHVVQAGIHTYGETVHIFIERRNYNGIFLPGYQPWNPPIQSTPVGLRHIDHMVGNVGWNEMNTWTSFYEEVMGFKQIISFDDKDISTEYTALMSKVMSNGNGRIKFPINEPAEGKKKSQVEEYLHFHDGPGVQHIAVATDDIVETISQLQDRGIEFLMVPDTYYDHLKQRVGVIDEDIQELKKLGILVDRDDEGYLLQIFTKPIGSRPTLFFEIIQRKGATSFGKGNFRALFEAIEREQELRGTLT